MISMSSPSFRFFLLSFCSTRTNIVQRSSSWLSSGSVKDTRYCGFVQKCQGNSCIHPHLLLGFTPRFLCVPPSAFSNPVHPPPTSQAPGYWSPASQSSWRSRRRTSRTLRHHRMSVPRIPSGSRESAITLLTCHSICPSIPFHYPTGSFSWPLAFYLTYWGLNVHQQDRCDAVGMAHYQTID